MQQRGLQSELVRVVLLGGHQIGDAVHGLRYARLFAILPGHVARLGGAELVARADDESRLGLLERLRRGGRVQNAELAKADRLGGGDLPQLDGRQVRVGSAGNARDRRAEIFVGHVIGHAQLDGGVARRQGACGCVRGKPSEGDAVDGDRIEGAAISLGRYQGVRCGLTILVSRAHTGRHGQRVGQMPVCLSKSCVALVTNLL